MRKVVKTANKLDSIWTTLLVMPALFLVLNAGIAVYKGEGTKQEVVNASGYAAEKFVNQYVPFVDGAGALINTGVAKASKLVSACLPGKRGPVYLDLGMTARNGCKLDNPLNSASKILPYHLYR